MRRMKWTKLLTVATVMTLMGSMPAMAAWQYTLQGPIAIWTDSTTGQQVVVYAGQAAPDGTPAPDVTVKAETFTTEAAARANTAQTIAAANAAADAAKAARGGNSAQDGTLTAAQLAANTAAANANLPQETVTTITKTLSQNGKSTTNSSYTNATLPTIQTGDQSAANQQNGLTANSYLSPTGVDQKKTGTTYNASGTYSYYASDGHLVTNASSPDIRTQTAGTATTTGSTTQTTGTTAAQTTSTTQTTGTNYSGTLPSTGKTNVNTYTTPGQQ
ncbi:MAG TPA: hypothetical protein DD632_00695 [Oribacterium sp.]|nr:hypothetical protein [Oribacterium sp.]HCS67077.1 hypothetical protein [Oribacterium sp.]